MRWKKGEYNEERDEIARGWERGETHVARDGRVLIHAECIYECVRIRRTCAAAALTGSS